MSAEPFGDPWGGPGPDGLEPTVPYEPPGSGARLTREDELGHARRMVPDLEAWARSISKFQMALRIVHELLDGGPGSAGQLAERLTEKNEDGCVFTEQHVDDGLAELDLWSLLEYPSMEDNAPVQLRAPRRAVSS